MRQELWIEAVQHLWRDSAFENIFEI